MTKEKVIDNVVKSAINDSTCGNSSKSNMIFTYLPILIGIICLVVCYLLYKKFQSINSQNDSLSKIEKQFTHFSKEQNELNGFNNKKLNAIVTQINQLNYVMQNSQPRENNTFRDQLSPTKELINQENTIKSESNGSNGTNGTNGITEKIKQPVMREQMPSSVIQTQFPVNQVNTGLPLPVPTINKQEIENNTIDTSNTSNTSNKSNQSNQSTKKVINIQTLKEEVLIEEASDSENEN